MGCALKSNHGSAVGMLIAGIIGCALFAGSTQAWAGRHDKHGDRRDDRRSRTTFILPKMSVKIVLGRKPYFYHRGSFYRRRFIHYVLVPAPVGAVVQEIPAGYQSIVINGVNYLNYDGVYYKSGPAGYTVVSLPIDNGYVANPVQIASAPASQTKTAGNTVTINVPNSNGSYTPVVLEEINGTYVGPRGEVYPTKPEMSQLHSMYGQ